MMRVLLLPLLLATLAQAGNLVEELRDLGTVYLVTVHL
jgi:hypothetical protein